MKLLYEDGHDKIEKDEVGESEERTEYKRRCRLSSARRRAVSVFVLYKSEGCE